MNRTLGTLLIVLILVPVSGWANPGSEEEKRNKFLVDYIQDNWYETETGLWRTTSWWKTALELLK